MLPAEQRALHPRPRLDPGGCRACGVPLPDPFYRVAGVPVHSVRLIPTRADAERFPTGDIALACCAACGFIQNVAFDPSRHDYFSRYEETQGFSPTFSAFARRQAVGLIERHGLRGKTILDIGCGKGEFLALLCALGDNRGIGVDPSYAEGRIDEQDARRITFIKDVYRPDVARGADAICCRMTLEHIARPVEFLRLVREGTGGRPETLVFFQVPDVRRILQELAFWDIYYEHCSYFSAGSLARLFRDAGFEVLRLERQYAGQYLTVEARPGSGAPAPALTPAPAPALVPTPPPVLVEEEEPQTLVALVGEFARRWQLHAEGWRARVESTAALGRRVVLWGAGSKSVAFLTTLNLRDTIAAVVDINPYKQGTFLAGTGHEIVPPQALAALRPDLVVAMNPVYREEIRAELSRMGLAPELLTL